MFGNILLELIRDQSLRDVLCIAKLRSRLATFCLPEEQYGRAIVDAVFSSRGRA
jgi:hypothetical protein